LGFIFTGLPTSNHVCVGIEGTSIYMKIVGIVTVLVLRKEAIIMADSALLRLVVDYGAMNIQIFGDSLEL